MILCEWDAPEGHPGQCCVHLYASVFYRRLSPQFQFFLSAVTLVYLSQWLLNTHTGKGLYRVHATREREVIEHNYFMARMNYSFIYFSGNVFCPKVI
jgi:hypothetical protein